jgi:hypothetical protein
VRRTFERHGFDACLDFDLSAPERALSTALRSGIKFGELFSAAKLERPNKDTPAAVGVYERIPIDGEGGDVTECGARVRIESATGLAIVRPPEGKVERPGCIDVAEQIATRCNELLANVENQELSAAIVAAGRSVMWAAFRKAGGAYWVPSNGAARLRGLFDELEAMGGFFPTLQPLFADDAGRTARNVGFAADEALRGELEELTADLARADGGELQQRGIKTRIAHCREVLIRCETYREALSTKADSIAAAIDKLMNKFGALIEDTDTNLNAGALLTGGL